MSSSSDEEKPEMLEQKWKDASKQYLEAIGKLNGADNKHKLALYSVLGKKVENMSGKSEIPIVEVH